LTKKIYTNILVNQDLINGNERNTKYSLILREIMERKLLNFIVYDEN